MVGSGFLIFYKDQTGADLFPQGKNVFAAILSAFLLGIGGYAKSTTPEDFDPAKFLATFILSIFIGLAMFYLHLDYATAVTAVEGFLINTGLLASIEVWLKVIVRQYTASTSSGSTDSTTKKPPS